jgi:quercetin dioxygenase-like cupin family protein
MDIVRLADTPPYNPAEVVANAWLTADQCSVRVIRLSPGQTLPPHRHGVSDLMLYVVEGDGTIDAGDTQHAFTAGSLAHYTGDEELRVSNTGAAGMTMLAFLAPPFPPAAPAPTA